MGKLKITIDTDNAAFGDSSATTMAELAEVVRSVVRRLEHGKGLPYILRDSNGNTVGRAEWENR